MTGPPQGWSDTDRRPLHWQEQVHSDLKRDEALP